MIGPPGGEDDGGGFGERVIDAAVKGRDDHERRLPQSRGPGAGMGMDSNLVEIPAQVDAETEPEDPQQRGGHLGCEEPRRRPGPRLAAVGVLQWEERDGRACLFCGQQGREGPLRVFS